MFTGIVEELGEIAGIERLGDSVRLRIHGHLVTVDAATGDSIAVDGVCLTVASTDNSTFTADVMPETLHRSSLGRATTGSRVNLERAARLDSRLGGHLVQGHVDALAEILGREPGARWEVVRISLPPQLARYVVPKGSIAVDGVSLTAVDVGRDGEGDWFTVSLIPTTLALTTLGRKQVGDVVNLEVDVLAKYVERLLATGERAS